MYFSDGSIHSVRVAIIIGSKLDKFYYFVPLQIFLLYLHKRNTLIKLTFHPILNDGIESPFLQHLSHIWLLKQITPDLSSLRSNEFFV